MFFEVVPTQIFRKGSGTLTYTSPFKLLPGQIVLIPLGKRTVTGIVIRKVKPVNFPTKPITKLLHSTPLPTHLLRSLLWMSEYYLTPLPQIAALFLPGNIAARGAIKSEVKLDFFDSETSSKNSSSPERLDLFNASCVKPVENYQQTVNKNNKPVQKICKITQEAVEKSPNTANYSCPTAAVKKSPKLAAAPTTATTSAATNTLADDILTTQPNTSHTDTATNTSHTDTTTTITPPTSNLAPATQTAIKIPLITLNSAQKQALAELDHCPNRTKLLHGITGSGKTNIYLQLTANTLRQHRSVILLVPEIALTSQLVKVFEETFGDMITLIHSGQSLTERRQTWLSILETTTPKIVIGPRSALLAPLQNLGLIIIDEAHETTYYQDNAPKYSALRLASFIANTLKITCVQGTATPNLIDFHLAKTRHSLVELSQKAKTTAITPKIELIDLRNRINFNKNHYFSDQLLASIAENLERGWQSLIFHNRRGSAPMTICENCGWQALCPNCYLPLTLHSDGFMLHCHTCDHQTKVPTSCPECHYPSVVHKGFGTKLLENELTRLFPKAHIARFDADTAKTATVNALYQDLKSGKVNLLIGTQTLAKGLDLPYLATVGVVQADAGLSLPDFTTEERTFELLTQVIGRVGRGHLEKAHVIIQTYQPDHPAIRTAIKVDYQNFASQLLCTRKQQQLPPFTYLAKLSVSYKTEATTIKHINIIHQLLQQHSALTLSPPLPAFHEHTARGYTWQFFAKCSSRNRLLAALKTLSTENCQITLDPPSLL